jgi:hypothetical protein
MNELRGLVLMLEYRLYILDAKGHFADVEEFVAVTDQEAMRLADRRRRDAPCELWRSTQLIAKIAAEAPAH